MPLDQSVSQTSSTIASFLSLQINNIDSYQCAPGPLDKRTYRDGRYEARLPQVPVIRVFGTTVDGYTATVHVHGVFPYVYVEYAGDLDRDGVMIYISSFYKELNTALCDAFHRDPSKPSNQFVADIVLCRAVPFYGFHVGWKPFLKICLVNPAHVYKCSELLRNGAIKNTSFQLYEAHIPYFLQFFVDFNLYGCGMMRLSNGEFRSPIDEGFLASWRPGTGSGQSRLLSDSPIVPTSLPTCKAARMTHSKIEFDISAAWIDNRLELENYKIHADLALEHNIPPNHHFLSSMRALWHEDRLRRLAASQKPYVPPKDIPRSKDYVPWSKEIEQWEQFAVTMSQRQPEHDKPMNIYIDRLPTLFETATMQSVRRSSNAVATDVPNKGASEIGNAEVEENDANNDDDDDDDGDIREIDDRSDNEYGGNSGNKNDDNENDNEKYDENDNGNVNDNENDLETGNQDEVSKVACVSAGKSKDEPLSDDRLVITDTQETSDDLRSPRPRKRARKLSTIRDSAALYFSESFGSLRRHVSTYISEDGRGRPNSFHIRPGEAEFVSRPPTAQEVADTFKNYGLPTVVYQEPYYSNKKDIPKFSFHHAGQEYKFKPTKLGTFKFPNNLAGAFEGFRGRRVRSQQVEYSRRPPTYDQVNQWLEEVDPMGRTEKASTQDFYASQIRPTTQFRHFKYKSQKPAKRAESQKRQEMSVLAIEIHVNSDPGKAPNPERNGVACLFWRFSDDLDSLSRGILTEYCQGIIIVGSKVDQSSFDSMTGYDVQIVDSELDLADTLIRIVRYHDPDVLTGYEIHSASWGYIIERMSVAYQNDVTRQDGRNRNNLEILDELSRVITQSTGKIGDKWGYTHGAAYKITGRHMLNIWRTLRSSVDLSQYTLENCVFHLLHERTPQYSNDDLTRWFSEGSWSQKRQVLQYYTTRVDYDLRLVHQQELITRYSEQARILGIDYYSVLSRGSQFKVESLMARLCRSENYILSAPNKKQVGSQNALEYIPLIMEPRSGFYPSPMLVLDFQSLYPSIVIAYNYCYSTCLGRAQLYRGRNKFGIVSDLEVDREIVESLLSSVDGGDDEDDKISMAPNGMVYVKPSVRKSLLAKMLTEILETRVMVKDAMKTQKDDEGFQRSMNNRQLALKLIANVTYGYTSATYSGRMPCAEIADSIVLTGREILERTISTINSNWDAKVVYGDTDSIFVYLPGRSKDQAFDIGYDIAETITSMYPEPIKLKFEKVYMGSVLQTKKRYVGYMYESKDQIEPVLDAKGIETIRRDGTPMQQKIEEKALRILFETADLSKVKSYLQEQWAKIMKGNVSIQDLCFAKEVRMGTYKDEGRLPPGAAVAAKKALDDERALPQYRERVPYVVITGGPGARLVDRCVDPKYLVENAHVNYDAQYYIEKNLIPPLSRIFNMMGANIQGWYTEMDKVRRKIAPAIPGTVTGRGIGQYYRSKTCIVCQKRTCETNMHVCLICWSSPASSVYALETRRKEKESKLYELETICRNCASLSPTDPVHCISGDCPIYYSRRRATSKLKEYEVTADQLATYDW